MIDIVDIEENISKYYDEQMNNSELLNFESKMQQSKYLKELVEYRCFEYFKISNSIKLQIYKAKQKELKLPLFVDFNSAIPKRLHERLGSLFLGLLRNNSK